MSKAGVADWRELREFAAVDLTRSFVLSWAFQSDTLLIDVDLYLEPDHAFYEKPRPAEGVCIRPAVIEFPHCARIGSDGETDANVSGLPPGRIEGLRCVKDGCYEITGVFGFVRIEAERPILRLKHA